MKYYLQIILMFTLIYNQIVYAKSDYHKSIKLSEIVSKYNEMRKYPSRVGKYLSKSNRDKFSSVIKVAKLEELPEIKKESKKKYILKVGQHKIIFDNKNWKKKRIRINNYFLNLSKVKSFSQLQRAITKIVSESKNKTSFVQKLWNIFFPSAQAFTFNKNMFIILAAVAAVVGIGTYALSRDNSNSSDNSNTGNNDHPTDTPIETNHNCTVDEDFNLGMVTEWRGRRWPVKGNPNNWTEPPPISLKVGIKGSKMWFEFDQPSSWVGDGHTCSEFFVIYKDNGKWIAQIADYLGCKKSQHAKYNFHTDWGPNNKYFRINKGDLVAFLVTTNSAPPGEHVQMFERTQVFTMCW